MELVNCRRRETSILVGGTDVGIASHKGIKVNDAKVIKTDIICDNGVIVIDAVLTLPKVKSTAS
jgi:uncharacterized surface protein with fasciclin (FAS1) repeats